MSLRNIAIGRYIPADSVVHSLDPRTKLACMLAAMACLFTGGDWAAAGICTVFIIAAAGIAGFTPWFLAKTILPFKWLILITIVLNAVFTGGHILIEAPLPYGGLTAEGLSYGGLYGLRIALLVGLASLLTLTTEPITLVGGVERLLAPLKHLGIRPHDIATAMMITIRFIPLLFDEAEKIRKAHQARGIPQGGGIGNRLRNVSMLLMPLMTTSIRRAEDLALAMDCRLYGMYDGRTNYEEFTFGYHDVGAVGITLFFCAAMVLL